MHQLAVAETIGEEVQVVEADQRAELDRRVDRPADRDRDHGVGAEIGQRGDVGPVRDQVGQPAVALAVARDVEHLGAGERPARDLRLAPTGGDRLRAGAFEPRERVGPRAGDDPDRHGESA